ncbi:MAG: hypothetical protein WBP79_11330 [Candidatus Acidiferrales bacterium]
MAAKPKTFLAGAALVWRRQRVLWWIYILNVIFAFFATRGMVEHAGTALNHSIAGQRLVHGFDLAAFLELVLQPEAPIQSPTPAFFYFPIVFMVFMLFAVGGVLATYYHDERLTAGPFFEACGHHFWRFFRLLIYLAIVFIPIGILAGITGSMYNRIDERSISPLPAVRFFVAAGVVILFLMLCIRLWFDMAQVIAVAEDERRMHKALRRAARLVRQNFGSLFWLYLRISLVSWVGFGLALQCWKNHLHPESVRSAFLLGQAMIVFWLGTRLWQRASEALWYRRYQEASAMAPVPEPVLVPASAAAPAP